MFDFVPVAFVPYCIQHYSCGISNCYTFIVRNCFPFQKRSGSLISSGRTGKSDSIRRHRDSSLSDASEGGLRTPGSKNTVSPGSTRSPKEVEVLMVYN